MLPPHGGSLVNRIAKDQEKPELRETARKLKKITLNSREVSDLEMIAVGAFSPLEGFMKKHDYTSVLRNMRLANGLPWTIPITLSVSEDQARGFTEDEEVALLDGDDRLLALLHLEEKYEYDKEEEAVSVYGTTDEKHPGVKNVYRSKEVLLGGPVTLISRPSKENQFTKYWRDPSQTRELFARKGWKSVVGFQTRNPVHRAHEYIQKCALQVVDGLLIHPLVGATKSDDIPADVRMKCYEVLLENYFPPERVALSVLPAAMRYAGPKEAIFHAVIRQNYGCTHFIVGRDHAGFGQYYGSFDAHYIFDEFNQDELGIKPMFFDYTYFCRRCGEMVSNKTCPHDVNEHISLSGTKVREMLSRGEVPPPEFTRPEVAEILIEWANRKLEYQI